MAKTYCIVVGLALVLIGIVGFLTPSLMGLEFTTHHNIIHLASGLVGVAVGFGGGPAAWRMFALIFGAVYTLVAIIGFMGYTDLGPIMLHLNMSYNIIHILIGGLGLLAGMASPRTVAVTA